MEILEKDLKMVTGNTMTIAMPSVTMDMHVSSHSNQVVIATKLWPMAYDLPYCQNII